MELNDVVFEYGKLQLNYVAANRQVAQLASQLAATNKRVAELEDVIKKGKAENQSLLDRLNGKDVPQPGAPSSEIGEDPDRPNVVEMPNPSPQPA